MEFKGTKEKWEVLEGTSLIGVKIGHKTFGIDNINEEAKANALLISKSREMLEFINEFYLMCISCTYPTEHELEYFAAKSCKLIKEATEI